MSRADELEVRSLGDQVARMLRSARDQEWTDNRCSLAAHALATRVESGDFSREVQK